MLHYLIFVSAVATLISGLGIIVLDPSLITALTLGLSLSLFLLLIGVKEWMTSIKTASVILFCGSGAVFLYTLRSSLEMI